LPGGQFARGNWDLRNSFEKYTANVQFARKRVLDVGTASGFLSFEAEKRGAEVVSFDSASPKMHAGVPFLDVRRRGGTAIEEDFEGIRMLIGMHIERTAHALNAIMVMFIIYPTNWANSTSCWLAQYYVTCAIRSVL
jgi:hypothetical protein